MQKTWVGPLVDGLMEGNSCINSDLNLHIALAFFTGGEGIIVDNIIIDLIQNKE